MLKTNSRAFLVSLFFIGAFSNINALAQQNSNNADSLQHFSIGLYWNSHTIISNYPTWEFSSQFMWKNRFSIDLGAGYVFGSEVFASSKEYIEHKTGFSLIGEVKYFIYKTKNNNGPYIGLGYRHLETSYTANYIIKITNSDGRYYQYVEEDYFIKQDQFLAKFGYKLTGADDRLIFEFGINLGFSQKTISPTPEEIEGRLVTNEKFLSGLTDFPVPFSIDAKIGFILFSN